MKPLIIDVEASGFGGESYPIEVGVALPDDSKYCSLILPASEWSHWDADAEKIHRIARDILETYGKPVCDVATELNRLFAGKTLYTDGWVVDKPWLITLFHEARMDMNFGVSPLEMILSERQMECWHDTKDLVLSGVKKPRHRASFDAWIIQETFRRTLTESGA
jgi:putative intracellular protease/amidase